MSLDVAGRSAMQIAALLQSGTWDAVAVAEATLSAIASCEDKAIFVAVTPERAMAEAQAASKRLRAGRPRGLLDGVPIAWKDLFDLEGMVTTAGSRVLGADPAAVRDAAVVARLQAAGMV